MPTIVKANYRSASADGADKTASSLRYYAYRKDRDGDSVERTGFSRDKDGLDLQQMTDVIKQQDGQFYYRLVLSPGVAPDTAVDLQAWTRDILLELEKDHGEFPYVAIEHRDQTDYAHVHVVLILDKKLSRDDFEALRETGSQLFEQRRVWYEPEQERSFVHERHVQDVEDDAEVHISAFQDDPDVLQKRRGRNRGISLDR